MNKSRVIFFSVILLSGVVLVVLLINKRIKTQYETTLAPAFQLLGLTTKTVDRTLSRVIPLDATDEGEYGRAIAARYECNVDPEDKDHIYVNQVMAYVAEQAHKPFEYKTFVVDYYDPNAFALPGGVVIVTRGLLDMLESEAQLAGILAHEIGHIELSHCFDLVKFEILTEKYAGESIGFIADMIVALFLRHSFSKTMENEADEFAFATIRNTAYDPYGVGEAFEQLNEYYEQYGFTTDDEHADVLRDYFMSHPPLELRIEKFKEKAKAWEKNNPHEVRVQGIKSFSNRRFDKEALGIEEE